MAAQVKLRWPAEGGAVAAGERVGNVEEGATVEGGVHAA